MADALGRDGDAPAVVVARAPAALARRSASSQPMPEARPAASTPQKASPAATVSMGVTG